jgi:hypothetical protein
LGLGAYHTLVGSLQLVPDWRHIDESRKYIAELGTVAPHLSIERYLKRPAPMRAAQPELSRGLRLALAPKI